jgi:hypothetical protein
MAAKKKPEAGTDVDSYCGKCKLMLAHVIHAMEKDKPAKVECKTCKAVHKYRPTVPGTRKAAAKKKTAGASKTPATNEGDYETIMAEIDVSKPVEYAMQEVFEEQAVVNHQKFGVGLVTQVLGGRKINIMFREGTKLLAHSR